MGKQRQVVTEIKVQVTGGQATPAPPVGTALGPHGVNIGQFVQQFNERTRDMMGVTIPCVVTTTTKQLPEGSIVKRRWSSTAVPGFLVKMESKMESPGFSLAVNEWITDFQATATPSPAK